jgi:Uma2 family endonuclease
MAVAQRMSEEAYQEYVLVHPDGRWELHDGRLVEKPGMTWEHSDFIMLLSHLLQNQLRRHEFRVHESRIRRSPQSIYIPDLIVVPTSHGAPFRDRPGTLAIHSEPLPLVVEVWSRTTGNYDVDAKIPVYQQRGDLEIWRIHPYEQTLTTWVRQPDGAYVESIHRGEIVELSALPGVTIDLDELFDN